jgi:hypothetical protein
MNEAKQGTSAPSAEAFPHEAHAHQPTIKELLGELTFLEWLESVRGGLRMPKDSGEYRYAYQQMQRLWSPVCGILLPLFLIGILMATPEQQISDKDAIPVTIEAAKANDVLKDDPQTKEPEPVEPPPPDDTNINPEPGDFAAMPGLPGPVSPAAGPSTAFSPQPAAFDSVAMVKSPIVMKGVYASRAPGAKGMLSGKGVGGGGMGGGDRYTEDAVVRALRWLKKNQQADGSWNKNKVAMTGLAILTYLAHGETPSESKEFGTTVQKAIEYLLNVQNKTTGRIPGNYDHPIATYALCEAYGMTLNPNVKEAAEKAVALIIKGQHPTGGWTYNLDPDVQKPGKEKSDLDGKYRDDTSYMGWCAQALKAAKLAKLHVDGLEKASKLAVKGFKKNANPNGGFGYTGPGQTGMTAVGTLCMQLLGASNDSEVKKSLDLMDAWVPSFEAKGPQGASIQYYSYYTTQCKFHAGGKRFELWNKEMKPLYLKAQKIEKSAIKDDKGRDCDIGWWENADTHGDRPVMDTCLAALQLMVYYRNLPTTKLEAVQVEEEITAKSVDTGDIKVDTGNL